MKGAGRIVYIAHKQLLEGEEILISCANFEDVFGAIKRQSDHRMLHNNAKVIASTDKAKASRAFRCFVQPYLC